MMKHLILGYNSYMNTNTQTPKLVQDRKTGEWYDPEQRLKELFDKPWFVAIMKRLKDR